MVPRSLGLDLWRARTDPEGPYSLFMSGIRELISVRNNLNVTAYVNCIEKIWCTRQIPFEYRRAKKGTIPFWSVTIIYARFSLSYSE